MTKPSENAPHAPSNSMAGRKNISGGPRAAALAKVHALDDMIQRSSSGGHAWGAKSQGSPPKMQRIYLQQNQRPATAGCGRPNQFRGTSPRLHARGTSTAQSAASLDGLIKHGEQNHDGRGVEARVLQSRTGMSERMLRRGSVQSKVRQLASVYKSSPSSGSAWHSTASLASSRIPKAALLNAGFELPDGTGPRRTASARTTGSRIRQRCVSASRSFSSPRTQQSDLAPERLTSSGGNVPPVGLRIGVTLEALCQAGDSCNDVSQHALISQDEKLSAEFGTRMLSPVSQRRYRERSEILAAAFHYEARRKNDDEFELAEHGKGGFHDRSKVRAAALVAAENAKHEHMEAQAEREAAIAIAAAEQEARKKREQQRKDAESARRAADIQRMRDEALKRAEEQARKADEQARERAELRRMARAESARSRTISLARQASARLKHDQRLAAAAAKRAEEQKKLDEKIAQRAAEEMRRAAKKAARDREMAAEAARRRAEQQEAARAREEEIKAQIEKMRREEAASEARKAAHAEAVRKSRIASARRKKAAEQAAARAEEEAARQDALARIEEAARKKAERDTKSALALSFMEEQERRKHEEEAKALQEAEDDLRRHADQAMLTARQAEDEAEMQEIEMQEQEERRQLFQAAFLTAQAEGRRAHEENEQDEQSLQCAADSSLSLGQKWLQDTRRIHDH